MLCYLLFCTRPLPLLVSGSIRELQGTSCQACPGQTRFLGLTRDWHDARTINPALRTLSMSSLTGYTANRNDEFFEEAREAYPFAMSIWIRIVSRIFSRPLGCVFLCQQSLLTTAPTMC